MSPVQHLTRVTRSDEAAWYAIGGDHQSEVSRWVVTTPWSREICNRPELLGCEYTSALRRAMTAALRTAPFRAVLESQPATRVCVLHFLRGGLNFDLRNALHDAYGWNAHASAFMSSQRYKVDGRWAVHEDMYRKLMIPPGALLLAADVVATGVTVANGLEVLLEHLLRIGSSIRGLVFFTIGCHKLEKVLATFDARLRAAFPGYLGSHAVYLDGKFRLVDSRTDLRLAIPGTDLIRLDALLTPELEASQLDIPAAVLERCVIYDAGSRAFDLPTYVEDVADYWRGLARHAAGGLTLAEAVAERWPAPHCRSLETLRAHARETWRGVGDDEVEALWHAHQARLSRLAGSASPEALAALAEERIRTLERTLE
jgi:hypothetical protein